MTKKPDAEEPAFKVVDRRRFDEEGREKACCDHDHGHDHGHSHSHSHSHQEPEAKNASASSHSEARMPINFSLFVQTLAHQAMMGLGMVPWPDSNLIKKDLGMAKETIDLLHILKAKTKGNLDQDEQAMLDSIVYQLQVAYVELNK